MSDPFHMVRLYPDLRHLAVWGHGRKLVTRSGDLGYVLHAALKAAFQELAPKPFRLIEPESGQHTLLGYTDAGADRLTTRALAAEADTNAALGLRSLDSKIMPTRWRVGDLYHFELRARPVIRTDGQGGRESTRERDAFLQACDAAGDAPLDRGAVYADWLARQLKRHGGAQLPQGDDGQPQVTLRAFQRLRIARRSASRSLREIAGPDAVLAGVIEVTDAELFAGLLRRGIGRHRVFGYGMLLLKPVATLGG